MSFRRLQLRFLLVVLASSLLFATLAGAIAFRYSDRQAIEAGRHTLEDLLGAVEKTAAIAAFTADKVLMQEIVDGLARNGLAATVQIVTTQGATLERRKYEQAPVSADQVTVVRDLVLPFEPAEVVGQIRIDADMDALERIAGEEATKMALAMMAQVALMALVLYLAASKLVSRPIVRLAGALRTMEPGTGRRLSVPGRHANDEIGGLIAGANALLDANEHTLDRERRLRAEVEALEARYRKIFDASSAGIFVLDADGRLINGNPTVSRVIGVTPAALEALHGEPFVSRVFAQPDRVQAMIDASARKGETVSADLELLPSSDGARWVHCLVSAQGILPGSTGGQLVEGVMYDVTDRKHAEHAVRHQAEHDGLTGLKNRAACDAAIDRMLADAVLPGAEVSLLYVDLDGFKRVNDTLGHTAGDQVLLHCARHMERAARRSADIAGRIGGDEFVVALYRCGPDDLHLAEVAAELVQALCEPIPLGEGRHAQIGASIGIASYPLHGRERRDLAQRADEALYAVKRAGKNSYAMAMLTS